jgi:class 3 adenylate cyclase/tetratricopeptide (TPR) repeat protein
MSSCLRCGKENPDDARFCNACGAVLGVATAAGEERKVVTVLFADLVGFTATAERLDPEDVRALQEPYWQYVRSEIERHGGTVEKFIGDAVVALFGAPVAHEDDPERAVRAALAIREWAREQEELHVRIALTTGEALVRLAAQPLAGEGMASGDVVNVASRLQQAAPANGILVDEPTRQATRDLIDYADSAPVEAKGKQEPIRVWLAVEARSRFGVDVLQHARTPLVGRMRELDMLKDALARVTEERSPQLVTLIGVPGIGKSRLVYELMRAIGDDPSAIVTWRQGRSLPYGDGVSFWALAEIVKAETGILDTDGPADAKRKLRHSLASLVEREGEQRWLDRHLRPLVGLPADAVDAEASEAFAAWRRYLEALADRRPLVLVFEDLHWADEALLDFVDHLVDWASGISLLVVVTARPELLERRPSWGGGKLNSVTLALSPLGRREIGLLIEVLLAGSELAPVREDELVEHVGGNPLFAEQFARMLLERSDAELPMVETVQALIAARLDLLPPDEKSLLQDAAVVGKVFWLGSVVDGRAPGAAEEALHALERKGFVVRARRSSLGSEHEYAFSHVLLRDVSYGQIARPDRVDKHLRTAAWVECVGRREEQAETLAHHYSTALELARALGRPVDALVEKTRLALRDAGERALGVKAFARAVRFYEDALALWPDADGDRAALLFRYAWALHAVGDSRDEPTMEAARAAFLAAQDLQGAAEADARLAVTRWFRGDPERAHEHLERAARLVENRPSSPEKARVLSTLARLRTLAGEAAEGARIGQEALELSEQLELHELHADTLVTVGAARWLAGDPGGADDLESAIDLAFKHSALTAAQRGLNNLAMVVGHKGDYRRRVQLLEQSHVLAEQLGEVLAIRHVEAQLANALLFSGDWDRALARAEQFIHDCETGSPHVQHSSMLMLRARVRFARDDETGALRDAERAVELARRSGSLEEPAGSLGLCARLNAKAGLIGRGQQLADELLSHDADTVALEGDELAWAAAPLDRVDAIKRKFDAARPRFAVFHEVASLMAKGEIVSAAELAEKLEWTEEPKAETHRLAGEMLLEARQLQEARHHLDLALKFYRSVGATRYIREVETLLAAIESESEAPTARPRV